MTFKNYLRCSTLILSPSNRCESYISVAFISKFTNRNSEGYFKDIKNSGEPEKDKGDIGPVDINGYSLSPKLL
jgi:hypothetical protein